jgi:PGF-pre-PGF domain-containing protein
MVGAAFNDTGGSQVGAAYLFVEPTGGWSGTTSASAADATFTGGARADDFGLPVALSSDGSRVLVGAYHNGIAGVDAGAAYLYKPPYATLTAGGTTTGTTGTTVNGLTLNPTLTLTNIDLYLGTSATAVTGTPVKTGIASLPAASVTTVDGIELSGKTPGTYYIIASSCGTTTVLAATGTAAYSVTAAPVTTATTVPVTTTSTTYTDSNDDGRSSSYTATSSGTGTGGQMTFAISESLTDRVPWAIISVTLVPKEEMGETLVIVTDSYTADPDIINGSKTAGVVSIVVPGVNPSKIDYGIITFAIDAGWLEKYHLGPEDIVLMHNVDGAWVELETTYDYASGGVYYFSAKTPGFSYFAIAGRAAGSVETAEVIGTAETVPSNVIESTGENVKASGPVTYSSARTVSSQPAAAETTAAISVPAGRAGFPPAAIAMAGAGCVVLIGGGWYVRRWWIRRQNPARFTSDDWR